MATRSRLTLLSAPKPVLVAVVWSGKREIYL